MDFSDDFEHLLASPKPGAGSNIDALVARQIAEAVSLAEIGDKSELIVIVSLADRFLLVGFPLTMQPS